MNTPICPKCKSNYLVRDATFWDEALFLCDRCNIKFTLDGVIV